MRIVVHSFDDEARIVKLGDIFIIMIIFLNWNDNLRMRREKKNVKIKVPDFNIRGVVKDRVIFRAVLQGRSVRRRGLVAFCRRRRRSGLRWILLRSPRRRG